MRLFCATTNADKFGLGQKTLAGHDIELIQVKLGIEEIQGEDAHTVVRDKAEKAYRQLGKPVVVSDDWWELAALNGFPGPYMKSINHWFTPGDFMRLMHGQKDRSVKLITHLGYFDGRDFELFSDTIYAKLVDRPKGSYGPTIMKVVTLAHDNGLTISEVYDTGNPYSQERMPMYSQGWQALAKFLKDKE